MICLKEYVENRKSENNMIFYSDVILYKMFITEGVLHMVLLQHQGMFRLNPETKRTLKQKERKRKL